MSKLEFKIIKGKTNTYLFVRRGGRMVAGCSPFEFHQERFRLGFEPSAADFADSTALGWPTSGAADQYEKTLL